MNQLPGVDAFSDALGQMESELADYRAIRTSESPVRRDEGTGVCSVYTYADVSNVLRDSDRFSNTPPGARLESQHAMLFVDPPRHRELRTLVSKAFTLSSVARLEHRIHHVADRLLDDLGGQSTIDVMHAIADPLPEIVIAEMLGVDPADRDAFKRWSRAFSVVVTSQSAGTTELEEHLGVLGEMFAYFDDIIDARRRTPRDDLISDLVQAEEHGQRLTPDELRATCAQLLAAGNETTTNLIGNTVICLAQRPAILDALRTDPSLVAGVVEETLRFLAPVQFVPRFTKEPITVHGVLIEPDTPVLAMLASANRDDAICEAPDEFDPHRSPNRHLDFGSGIHFCLGAALARSETKITIERMVHRLVGAWEIPERLDRIPNEPFFFGVTSLPLHHGS